MNLRSRRKGGVPPIVTVLLILAFIIAAGFVGYYVMSTSRRSTRRCLLSIEGPVYAYGNNIYLTLRNDGTANCTLTGMQVVIKNEVFSTCTEVGGAALGELPPGESIQIVCSGGNANNFDDGDSGLVQTPSATLSFCVTKP